MLQQQYFNQRNKLRDYRRSGYMLSPFMFKEKEELEKGSNKSGKRIFRRKAPGNHSTYVSGKYIRCVTIYTWEKYQPSEKDVSQHKRDFAFQQIICNFGNPRKIRIH